MGLTGHGNAPALGLRADGCRFPWIADRSEKEMDHESAFSSVGGRSAGGPLRAERRRLYAIPQRWLPG
jgi:hypothetical protein